jgi:hypothetical protein
MRWAGLVARREEKRNAYTLLLGKPEGKRPLGRPRRRWVDNIRMDLKNWRMWIDILVGGAEGKRKLARSRSVRQDDIQIRL